MESCGGEYRGLGQVEYSFHPYFPCASNWTGVAFNFSRDMAGVCSTTESPNLVGAPKKATTIDLAVPAVVFFAPAQSLPGNSNTGPCYFLL